jgi:Mg/Co/Ni transporter MgtE
MLLNHVLVGVLLVPLGYLCVYAAPSAVRAETWARVIVRTVGVAVAALPIALLGLMGTRYFFDAPLFVLGAAITVAVATALLIAAFSGSDTQPGR